MRKNDILNMLFFFLKFSQNIDFGYTLETLHRCFFFICLHVLCLLRTRIERNEII